MKSKVSAQNVKLKRAYEEPVEPSLSSSPWIRGAASRDGSRLDAIGSAFRA